jgi:tetratricopeptide (TPR) repeat protein
MAENVLSNLSMAQAENDELPRNRWWLKLLVGLVILAALGVGGFLLYRKYEPERLTKRAQEYFEKDDHRNAVLTLRRALEIDPTNVSASRLMAKITESLQVPDALDWRRRLNELNPTSAADALAFAGTALRQGENSRGQSGARGCLAGRAEYRRISVGRGHCRHGRG